MANTNLNTSTQNKFEPNTLSFFSNDPYFVDPEMTWIHPTAIVSSSAEIGKGCKIGPYSMVGPHVKLGNKCVIHSHVVLDGDIVAEEENIFFQFCSIGAPPQDLSYKGERTQVRIGKKNIFREYVSVHRGTLKDTGITKIGNNNLLMSYVHVGHDDDIGSHCIIVNSCNLAGHVKIGDRVIIGGGTNISQFITLGRGAYIGGASAIDRDIPPFCTAYGNRVNLKGINIIGLKRQNYSKQEISEVIDFYRSMEAHSLSPRAYVSNADIMKDYQGRPLIDELCEFIKRSEIGIAPSA